MSSLHESSSAFDLLGIGNAIVDIQAIVQPEFLIEQGMVVGSMALIDTERAKALYALITPQAETSGGSVANTCVAARFMGAKSAYMGKVADDALGHKFIQDMKATGVHFSSQPAAVQEGHTALSLIMVTPDGQRTMNTYLGICTRFGPEDLDHILIQSSKILYLEGYLFDTEEAKKAFYQAAEIAHAAGRMVALSLSDPFCVERHRADFRALVAGHIDLLFANESEICALYETDSFDKAAQLAAQKTTFSALTRSEKGSVILKEGKTFAIKAIPTHVVDTTGAGDAYAAGFLAGMVSGQPIEKCGHMGSAAAAEVISHFRARLSSEFTL